MLRILIRNGSKIARITCMTSVLQKTAVEHPVCQISTVSKHSRSYSTENRLCIHLLPLRIDFSKT